jgi:hypothetical protein
MLQPAPFRVPLVDAQGQMVEVWRRFFLSTQTIVNFILTSAAAKTLQPGLLADDIGDQGEAWVLPGPQGPPGLTGPSGPSFSGLDGDMITEDAWMVPGPPGAAGATGLQGVPGMDGLDPEDIWLVGLGGLTRSGQVGLASPVVVGLDNRIGLTTTDVAALTLYTALVANTLMRVSADIFATAAVTGTATYTLAWTENATAQTMVVTATAINTLGTASNLIRPDTATTITAQLTGTFTGTFTVAGVVEQIA